MEDKKQLPSGFVLHGKRNYTVKSVLGKGGYGITYLAQHTQQGHNIPDKYAIKEFFMSNCCERKADGSVTMSDTQSKSAAEYKKAFCLEAEHLMDLNQYSGIVHVQEVFETNGTVYYVMEHLGDLSLTKLLKSQGGRLEESLAMKLVASVGRSLSVLHHKKMNHLDVKPDNIMLVGGVEQAQPVLIDFGLSRHYNIIGMVTNDMAAMGYSEGYSPAEQYVGIDEFAPTADVYALAATLFYMLTGHAPERATKISEAYLRTELSGTTSPQRVSAIVNAMKMNAAERTQSIEAFLSELGLYATASGTAGGTVDISTRKKPEINWVYVAGAAIIIALIGVIVYMINLPDKPQKDESAETFAENVLLTDSTIVVVHGVQNTADVEQATATPASTDQSESDGNSATSSTESTTTSYVGSGSQQAASAKSGPIDLGYAIWDGEIRNGMPHGYGAMTYKRDMRVDSRDANGTYAATGDVMKGEMRNGHWEYGTLYSQLGTAKAKISIGAE